MAGKDLRYTMSLKDRLSPASKNAAVNTKKADTSISKSMKSISNAVVKTSKIIKSKLGDAVKSAAASAKKAFAKIKNSARKLSNSFKNLASQSNLIKAAFVGVAAVVGGKVVGAFFRAGAQVETLTAQFETILGSTAAAKDRMEELTTFAAKTPFQLQGVANASRTLETLTRGTMSTGNGLRLVGDAAAASGANFENLAMHVGRAYSGLQANRPVGESLMRLQELGLVTGETRNEIEKLTKGGMGKKAWSLLEKELKLADGGMERLSKTVPGLASTIKDQLNLAMVKITSSGLWDELRKGMEGVTGVFEKALDNGTFEKIGMVLLNVSQIIKSTVATAFNFLGTIVSNVTSLILTGLSKITGAVAWLAEGIPEKIRPKWVGTISELSKTFDENATLMSDVATQFADKTVEKFGNVQDSFVSLKTTITTSGADIKKQLEEAGTGDGLEAKKRDVTQSIAVTADLNAVKEIHQEFSKIGKSERDKELMDIKFWYDEQLELLKGNKVAQGELEKLYLDKRLDVYKDYAAEEKKLDQDMIKNRTKDYLMLGRSIGQALGIGFSGQKASVKEAFKGVLGVTVDFLEKQVIAAVVGNQLKNFATLGPVGLLKAAGETALITGIFSAAKAGIQSFQYGGVVQKQPGVPETGDRTPIFANPGERVLTVEQQRSLANQNSGKMYQVTIEGTNINISGNVSSETVAEIDRTLQERNEDLRDQLFELSEQGRLSGIAF